MQVPTIALAMGEHGLISRLLAPKFGGFLTFASLESGKESAPGQLTVSDLQNIYGVGRAGRDTEIFGIIGRFVGYSKSPIIHNKFFQKIGYDGIYVPFLADDIVDFFNVYHVSMFSGFR
jgi:3-dehydroquinate dehydratase/shikimate dehydrogenase